MDKTIPTVIVVAIIVLALIGMYVGWRARQRRQAGFPRLLVAPDDLGTIMLNQAGLYVATTVAGEPLERITVAGLGYRARAFITVAESGVVLELTGEKPAFIPVADLVRAARATWTIDTSVEPRGLVLIGWRLGRVGVESYLRVTGGENELIAAVQSLIHSGGES